jgi:heme exporter protein A
MLMFQIDGEMPPDVSAKITDILALGIMTGCLRARAAISQRRPDPRAKTNRLEFVIIPRPRFHDTALQVQGLCFAYPQRPLFTDFSATIGPGLTLVRGGDGSGKTTLLRLLAGVLAAQAGHLTLNGLNLQASARAYQELVFWADPQATALDGVSPTEYFRSLPSRYPGWDAALAQDLAQALSLTPHLDKPMYMLSTGSRRKVWLAAAFASGAALTLLDEPFAALDRASVNVAMELFEEAAAHTTRAWVLAGYEAPGDVALAQVIELGGVG